MCPRCDPENSERDPVSHGMICVWYFDRVVRVGDGENPGSERDESASDAIGIARSVPSFVVGAMRTEASRRKKNGSRREAPRRG